MFVISVGCGLQTKFMSKISKEIIIRSCDVILDFTSRYSISNFKMHLAFREKKVSQINNSSCK